MMSENKVGNAEAAGLARYPTAERIGFARLTTMAFGGADLRPLRDQLLSKVAEGTAGAGEGLDLSLITQLLGDKQVGVAIQAEVLAFHQLYRSPCAVEKPKLRVLALAAPGHRVRRRQPVWDRSGHDSRQRRVHERRRANRRSGRCGGCRGW